MTSSPKELSDVIKTDDLKILSNENRYQSGYSYLGDGIFCLVSKGLVDEETLKNQIIAGDIARTRLHERFPDKPYHLLWDITEIKTSTLLSRHKMLTYLSNANKYSSVSLIGANNLFKSFGVIISKLVPNLNLYFFRTVTEAVNYYSNYLHKSINIEITKGAHIPSETDSYSRFISLWQENPEFITIHGQQYKMVSRPSWNYSAIDGSYKTAIKVIEGNIVYYISEGYARVNGVDATYGILEDIMHELGFNATDNKFYSFLNLKKLKGISLSARRQTTHYETLYSSRAYMVLITPSPLLNLSLKVLQKLNINVFSHWKAVQSTDEAFDIILAHRNGMGKKQIKVVDNLRDFQPDPLIVPKNQQEMLSLIRLQHEELNFLKRERHENIHKIVEIAGRMTWDESFNPPDLTPDQISPFNEVFNSLQVLYQDFKEIITEKLKDTQRLIESEDKYRNFVNLASDIILVYQDDEIKFLNDRVKQILGYDVEDVVGKSMSNYVVVDDIPRLKEFYTRRITDEDVPWIYETTFIHHDGHKVPVSMSVGKIMFENRPAVMVIARDVTIRKKNEEELERYRTHLEDIIKQRTSQLHKEMTERKIAEESDRLKTAFLSNMSHEIRTPMNAIISFSNFLKDSSISDRQRDEYVNYIISSGQSLLNLINDIIDLSKIEAQQLRIQESFFPVDDLLLELQKYCDAIRKQQNKTSVSLKLSIPSSGNFVTLKTDQYRLRQILSNLLDNALKFTDSGIIEFGYYIEEKSIIFFVKDTGIGIPESKKDLIFKRFGKLDNAGRNMNGTGLGLAISDNLAQLLSGKLWVVSKEGIGSEFYLKMPYFKTDQVQVREQETKKKYKGKFDWTGKHVLVAEDEELNFKVLDIALRKTGATVLRAYNGQEAVDMIQKVPEINIVLMDIQMPIMDGYEAMKTIKRNRPNIPIIAQTAFALIEEQKKCSAEGFNDYVSKPINIEELFGKMEHHLLG